MHTIHHELESLFASAISTLLPDISPEEKAALVEVTQSTQPRFGDYQCNSAMKMSKLLKAKPRDVAEKIIQAIESISDPDQLIEKLEIAGPGFINITLTPYFLEKTVNTIKESPRLGIAEPQHAEKIIVEFSSPNIAKELHVGHLRSTIIGESLARLFEFLGHDVLRLNHVGDWGTAFGMLIAHMKERYPEILEGKQETDLSHLVSWYKESKKRFDDDEDFKQRARLEVVEIQSGNSESLAAWQILCDISRKAFNEIYDLLNVHITERGESFYNPMLADVVADLESKGMITVSDGAKCVFLDGFINREGNPLPMMVQKSDGGYNYSTTDMAAIRHRIQDEKAERIIVVTDAGQATHFAMIFQAAKQAGYYNPEEVRIDHVPFGLVLGPDGKKFRTREGETERLIDLLNNAIEKSKEILKDKSPEMDPAERIKLAHALGISAVKYADLSCNRVGDYTFSYDRMLRFEGNTAAFVLYAYVRTQSIKRKILGEDTALHTHHHITLKHPLERDLVLHLLRFGEILDTFANDLFPHRLTEYLYELADKFHAFFRDCRVEGSEEQDSRLELCDLVGRTLKQGLFILGIETVERM